jgi:hypothetical protein
MLIVVGDHPVTDLMLSVISALAIKRFGHQVAAPMLIIDRFNWHQQQAIGQKPGFALATHALAVFKKQAVAATAGKCLHDGPYVNVSFEYMVDCQAQPTAAITLSLISQMSSLDAKYAADFQQHEVTRLENDRNLVPKLEAIRTGQDIESLERFAKAYLGMYLDIDNNIPPQQRIVILANHALAEAIQQGFEAVLTQAQFPDEVRIADAMMNEQPLAIGYILLAALDLFAEDPRYEIAKLPPHTIRSAICFHYAAKTEIQDKWFAQILIQRQDEVAQALAAFWQQLIARDCDHLPGLYQIIKQAQYDAISRRVVLPVLASLQHCRKGVLRDLLHAALRVCDHKELLRISEAALDSWNRADPSRYMLWLATTFLLQAHDYAMTLAEYCGHSKEKILPLLDFCVLVLLSDEQHRLDLAADSYAQLLRIIAAKFAPQLDRYGNLSDITQKVMYLFYRLAAAADAADAIQRLGQVRVMKLYNDILAFIAEQADDIPQQLSFEAFLTQLQAADAVKTRKKWSDLGH